MLACGDKAERKNRPKFFDRSVFEPLKDGGHAALSCLDIHTNMPSVSKVSRVCPRCLAFDVRLDVCKMSARKLPLWADFPVPEQDASITALAEVWAPTRGHRQTFL